MAANNKTVVRVANLTTDTTLVDTVTLDGKWPVVEIVNRSTEDIIYVSVGDTTAPPTNPTDAGDEFEPILPLERRIIATRPRRNASHVIKVIGSATPYSVIGRAHGYHT